MELIADKNGVDVIISPVIGMDGFQVNLDFNFPQVALYELDHRCKDWDLKLMEGRRHLGSARFTAYQFLADGIERRTIALKHIVLEPRHRGQKRSYDVAKFVIQTVQIECDRDWGPVNEKPVLFIEKKDIKDLPSAEREGFFNFLKQLGEKIFGFDSKPQPSGSDLSVSVIGDQISMQLIEGHLKRSNSLETDKRNPTKDR